MRFNYLKINGFGKLENKEIQLNGNINLIKGKNEAGKTTLLKFIFCMLYGASKNKNGKDISDFDKYLPWNGEEFSGKIDYELDSKEKFEVFRDFKKKGPQIFNTEKEDITRNFSIDKNKRNDFFYEQTKIDEDLFLSTTLVEQQEVELDEKGKNLLVQKITNLLSTGEDDISLQKSVDRLNKKLLEEIGTERTIGRPINIINERIQKLEQEKEAIEQNESKKNTIASEIIKTCEDIAKKENESKLLYKIKDIKEIISLEEEKINIKKKNNLENSKKIKEYKEKLIEYSRKEQLIKSNKENILIVTVLIIINIVINFIKLPNVIYILITLISLIYTWFEIFSFIKKSKKEKTIEEKKQEEKNRVKYEIEILKDNKSKQEKEIEEEYKKLEEVKENLKGNLKEEKNVIVDIDEILKEPLGKYRFELQNLEEELSKLKIKLRLLENENREIIEGEDKRIRIQESIIATNDKKEELNKLEKSIAMAKETLILSYDKMKKSMTPKFTKSLSNLVERISDEKYSNCVFNDEQGLMVELKSGEYINSNRLSTGTIEQLYLSLRLSTMLEISEENMPIILDEAFAYYDDNRLENTIKFLNNNIKENQILIFTCTNREQEILDKLNINYNLVEI